MEEVDISKVGPHLKSVDVLLDKTLLRFIPKSVSPNSVTLVRFVLVPVVIALLLYGYYAWATAVFAFSVITDAVDGALARTRDQITRWGKIADPLADKFLIGATALILVTQYISVWAAVAIVFIEIVLGARAAYLYRNRQITGANTVGKAKMIMQSIALLTLLSYIIWGDPLLLLLSTWGVYLSILFALASLFVAPSI